MKSLVLYPSSAEAVSAVAQLLRLGQVVALPTETVYGLAADAFNVPAVRQIFSIKGRPLLDPLIVHCYDWDALHRVAEIPPALVPRLSRLAELYWPGPLTVILPKKPALSDLVTAGRSTVAVRIPAHPLFRSVLLSSGLCLAAPSANPFGYVSPTSSAHVIESLGERLSAVLEGGPCSLGIESTILDLTGAPTLLRPGPITLEALTEALDEPVQLPETSVTDESGDGFGLRAPGLLSKHYSPRTPVILFDSTVALELPRSAGLPIAWVLLSRDGSMMFSIPKGVEVFWLSEQGDLNEVAQNLFALLRQLDNQSFGQIWVELPPHVGLGRALRDRLQRAAAKSKTIQGLS